MILVFKFEKLEIKLTKVFQLVRVVRLVDKLVRGDDGFGDMGLGQGVERAT